ncbi:MAG: type II secretion system protein [Minisyncoccia bacterium]
MKKIFIKITKNKLATGFTLVEALVAISILMISIAAPMTIAQNGLSTALFAREEMIAQFLAQDALEYVKYVRDNNAFPEDEITPADWWLAGLEDCTGEYGCEIDTINNDINQLNSDSESNPLRFNDSLKTYSYDNNMPVSNFARKMKINVDTAKTDESGIYYKASANVVVTWKNKNTVVPYELNTNIFNIR